MGKGSGTTKASGSINPKGLAGNLGIWSLGASADWTEAQGFSSGIYNAGQPEIRAKGRNAEELYSALNTSVELAVESRVGDIRSGGGTSGPMNDKTYIIIFRDNATGAQISEYLRLMKTGSRLYANQENAYKNGTKEEYQRAKQAYGNWFNKTYKK